MDTLFNFLWNTLPLWSGRVSIVLIAFYGTFFYLFRQLEDEYNDPMGQ